MADTKPTPEAGETSFIAVIPQHNPVLALTVEKDRDALLAHIEQEVKERTFDLSTAAGRDECRAFAAKITRTKTTLDKTATTLTEEWRQKTKAVNDARRPLIDRLAALAEQARQPLTEWENAEAARVEKVETTIQRLVEFGVVTVDATAASVEDTIAVVKEIVLDEGVFQGALEAAEKARDHTLSVLQAALARIRQQEEERAELDRLRAEAVARREEEERRAAEEARRREESERLEREQREAEERRRAEAEEADARRVREEAAAAAAEERRKANIDTVIAHIKEVRGGHIGGQPQSYGVLIYELEKKVVVDETFGDRREEAETLLQEALAHLKDAAEQERKREEEARAEAQRRAAGEAAQAERDAADRTRREAERIEQERRDAAERDAAHRQRCKTEAKEAIMSCGADEPTARNIVLAILANEVPRVTLDFAAEPRVRSSREAFEEARHDAHLESEDAAA
jgi:colicin import membrane protein